MEAGHTQHDRPNPDYYLVNAEVITPHRVLDRGGIHVRGARIERVFAMTEAEVPVGSRVVDMNGARILPGLIDLHLHGGGGADAMDGTAEAYLRIAEIHAAGGATSIVPTTITSSASELERSLQSFSSAKNRGNRGARLLGLHLEGPYFSNAQRGAQDPRYIKNPDPEEYLPILDRYHGILRVSAAPELPGALELGRELRRRSIIASIGHSDATYWEVVAGIEAGYTHVTHLYSGMSGVRRINCYRMPGVIETALLLDELTVEVIADGKHLPAPLLQLIYKCKGPGRIALISDATRAAAMPDGEYTLGSDGDGQKIVVDDGVAWLPDRSTFAGSVARANRLIQTMVESAEIPLREAVKMMTLTPARILGRADELGSLAPGKKADIVAIGQDYKVIMTIVDGRIVYAKPGSPLNDLV